MRMTLGRSRRASSIAALPVGGLADHLHVVLSLENHPEAGPDERLVVDDQDPDAAPIGSVPSDRPVEQHELVDPHRALEVLELLLAEVEEGELLVLEQRSASPGRRGSAHPGPRRRSAPHDERLGRGTRPR